MERSELVLGALAAGDCADHTPVQVQKLLFLVDKRLAPALGGPHFDFQPYFYGPFDRQVYLELEKLAQQGLVEISWTGTRKAYKLTRQGQERGEEVLATLPEKVRRFLRELSAILRGMSFGELVSAIYRAYPEMKGNSVFQTIE